MTSLDQSLRLYRPESDPLVIAGESFNSRLIIGTGKFPSFESLEQTIEASGAAIVTVALRRVSMGNAADRTLSSVQSQKVKILPNTSGARTAAEAVRLAKMARAAAGHRRIKLEVTPDPATLLPDPIETFLAAKELIADGFVVLPYINADPILAKRLEEIGCATVMPLGAPIGTNRGLTTRDQLRLIIDQAKVPVIIDAGLGLPSHACAAMELGAAGVMINTATATAKNPAAMGEAFKWAVIAGRAAHLAGPGGVSETARASSPETGQIRTNSSPGGLTDFLKK